MAITDRANRLTCANSQFAEVFGIAQAPPGMALEDGGSDLLTRAARAAWRDGSAAVERIHRDGTNWSATLTRAGLATIT